MRARRDTLSYFACANKRRENPYESTQRRAAASIPTEPRWFCEVSSVGSWAERLNALLVSPEASLPAYPAVGPLRDRRKNSMSRQLLGALYPRPAVHGFTAPLGNCA